jgi:hypothetical protein
MFSNFDSRWLARVNASPKENIQATVHKLAIVIESVREEVVYIPNQEWNRQ